MRIIPENYVDTATLSSSPVNTTVENLQVSPRTTVMTTNVLGAGDVQDILGDFDTAKSVSSIVIGRHTLRLNNTIRIYLYSGAGQSGTLLYDSGLITITQNDIGSAATPWGSFIYGTIPWGYDEYTFGLRAASNYVNWLSTTITNVLSFKISIGIIGSEVSIGRLIIGEYVEPLYNISYGHSLEWKEDSKQYRAAGGTLRTAKIVPVRKLTFSLSTIAEADRLVLYKHMQDIGLRKDFFISLFPTDSSADKIKDYNGIMKMTKLPRFNNIISQYYKSSFVLEEV